VRARDHGGGIDAAARAFGGNREDWLDLSTGINPVPYPLPDLAPGDWQALPDRAARDALVEAAHRFWNVPHGARVLAVPGLSSVIPRIPLLAPPGRAAIPGPTYNEHAAAFTRARWDVGDRPALDRARAVVIVNPNNPTGEWHRPPDPALGLRVIDESFADLDPARSLIAEAALPRTLVLKSFGKFWGLGGLRLGFVAGDPALVERLAEDIGPWPVSGPALRIGAQALSDTAWAEATRARLAEDAQRLDALVTALPGVKVAGGTALFRLYDLRDAAALRGRLALHRIWTRTFPWSASWLRIGLPAPEAWPRLEAALAR